MTQRAELPHLSLRAQERLTILRSTQTIAIVGVSSNSTRPSYHVASYMLGFSQQYSLFFVNPREDKILGLPCYPSLSSLPVRPDLVNVFRKSTDLPQVARETISSGAKVLWLQLGLWSSEAARIAAHHGIKIIMNRCIKIEHARFSKNELLASSSKEDMGVACQAT